ncbi:MAG: hypothetical protein ABI193_16975 [Minicystis sp.]
MPPSRPVPARLLAASVLFGLLAFLACTFAPREAHAYPWMIRHEYAGCSVCHGDPTGGGVLTAYGRAQGDLLMSTHYSKTEAEEPSKMSGFLFGAWEPPEWLLAGGDFRMMLLVNKVSASGSATPPPVDIRPIQMQSDLRLLLRPSIFRAGASIGYVHDGALAAKITTRDKDNLVSREHWVGVALKDEAFLLRAGRMNLPFGIRNIDHTLWVRKTTRTDLNTGQQHGISLAYGGESLRAEVMGILGNFQLNPDAYRDRGAVGFAEYTLAPKYTVGVSGLFVTTQLDLIATVTQKRGAAGLFGRASPVEPLVLSAEWNVLVTAPAGQAVNAGLAGMLQADLEPKKGIHALGTFELKDDSNGVSAGGWLGAWWFFLPHFDVRADGILQSVAGAGGQRTLITTFLAQAHAYL